MYSTAVISPKAPSRNSTSEKITPRTEQILLGGVVYIQGDRRSISSRDNDLFTSISIFVAGVVFAFFSVKEMANNKKAITHYYLFVDSLRGVKLQGLRLFLGYFLGP